MTTRLTVLLIGLADILVLTPCALASPLSDAAASLSPGEWAEVATTGISSALASPGASGNAVNFSDDIVWDPVTRQLLFVGGDHNACPVFATFSEEANDWQREPCPAWFGCDCGTVLNGTAMHGYDHSAINVATGEIFHRPPYGYYRGDVYKYSIDTGEWSRMPELRTSEYDRGFYGIDYFPGVGLFVYNHAVYLFDEETNAWTRATEELDADPRIHNWAEYNPVHNIMLFGNGVDGTDVFKMEASRTVTKLGLAPVGLGIMDAVVTVDPVSGDYLIFAGRTDPRFYVYDVTTDTWRLNEVTVPMYNGRSSNAVNSVLATPVSNYGVNLFVTCEGADCRLTIYKHAPGVGTVVTGRDGGVGDGGGGTPVAGDDAPDAGGDESDDAGGDSADGRASASDGGGAESRDVVIGSPDGGPHVYSTSGLCSSHRGGQRSLPTAATPALLIVLCQLRRRAKRGGARHRRARAHLRGIGYFSAGRASSLGSAPSKPRAKHMKD